MKPAPESKRYEDRRDPLLPWGYWYTLVESDDRGKPFEDENGMRWRSLREALWEQRFGMATVSHSELDRQLEFLLSVLVILDRRNPDIEEKVYDIFSTDWPGQAFYAAWMHGQRLLITVNGAALLNSPLTPEAKAILAMLAMTRAPAEAPVAMGMTWIRARGGRQGKQDREMLRDLLLRQERFAEHLPYRFIRGETSSKPTITLVGDRLGPNLPMRRVVWSMMFGDEYSRDRMYLWLHERIDRWVKWGEIAHIRGARALSEHLLGLAFCEVEIELA